MTLAIISHTAHYRTSDGRIVGWGPTVAEIDHLSLIFKKIYHVAFLHDENAPRSAVPYQSNKVEFVPLPPSGGNSLKEKWTVLSQLRKTIGIVSGVLKKSDIFQFRAPTGIGIYLIPYLTMKYKKKGWFKYAGNWQQKNPPFGYALQRWMLKQQSRKVTVNGSWPDQAENIVPFENPCLTQQNRELGKSIIEQKTITEGANICFVGSLTEKKGFDIFMSALVDLRLKFNQVHIVGDGQLKEKYEQMIPGIVFHGFQPREKVHVILSKCHFIVLPSLSEGFPKVIAEGMNYGCVPIVSDVSCIGQIIKDGENGFLIMPITKERLFSILKKSFLLKNEDYREIVKRNYMLSYQFTFNSFLNEVQEKILQKEVMGYGEHIKL
ncbi:Glycosyl transferases group 1 [Salinimicrobium sediminis]|uniref:Glycosyl transferases group 1 n=1 Tax=Salinimicrobium sediminis TaxID=1343891 RepID=A0A285WZJ1_9FLAO|nr:glycosyltransferase [Salinimicrobium sediminis]SOC78550.1 Glycosyl transferases group 1 [Salinimicrobium sediminis]